MNKKRKKLSNHEEIILSLQDHWIILIKPFLTLFIGFNLFSILFAINFIANQINILNLLLKIAAVSILVFSFHLFFIFLLEWLISNLIITTHQIINFRVFPFVENDVTYIEISQIHEIEKKQHGFIKNILNYGDIIIHISGSSSPINIQNIHQPDKVVDLIDAIKFKKSLEKIHFKGLKASFAEKYKFLEK